ncbi:multiple sugar transport system substrate-binding protein [Pullulanibacillus pueri]|uniref:Putative ABC transporter substrate-binding protein YesO n=2 Tax=Pullulanibacillus pueri TaxID=1437324 RepID=A0A8J2ZYJ4_9BACL|nr:extracellular solute-binding protein [Pullulanibacillus pueri]MBM7683515.1 multiple sugar transport system substrate-binding protein [Pullulanibacillus pueri]GGH86946.1 putative ABC transporter substrate-binding protein YesO [Pullulanibacillus pueri]
MYEKKHPNVKIEPEYATWDDYWKKLSPEAAANQLPDIIQMDPSYITQYANNNQLADLKPYLGKEIDTSDLSQNFLDTGKINGNYYGLSAGGVAVSYQYDPELLKKAGIDSIPENWTWTDYENMAKKAAAAGLYFVDGPGQAPDVEFNYYLRTFGKSLYSKDGKSLGYTDDQLFVDYFKMYAEMVKGKAIPSPDVEAQVKGLEDDPVVKQQSIGIVQWATQMAPLQEAANRPLEITGMPGPNADKGLFIKPSMYWSIANSSKNKSEAAKFVDFLTNNIEANKLMLGDRGVPGSPKVQKALEPLLTPANKQVFEYMAWAQDHSSAYNGPDPSGAGQVITLLTNVSDQIAYGKMKPEEAAKQFRQQANAILATSK